MSHTYTQLTEAQCAEEIRAICGEQPTTKEPLAVEAPEPEAPEQRELL